jgi:hypothetical protein
VNLVTSKNFWLGIFKFSFGITAVEGVATGFQIFRTLCVQGPALTRIISLPPKEGKHVLKYQLADVLPFRCIMRNGSFPFVLGH